MDENKVTDALEETSAPAVEEAAAAAVTEAVESKPEKKDAPKKVKKVVDPIAVMTNEMLRENPHVFAIGDTVKVNVRIKEGERQRIQQFEGTVIAKKHGGINETFTVRRTSYGVGVERVFPVNSPNVESVVVVRHGKARRSKLYYLRDRVGKSAKLKTKLDK